MPPLEKCGAATGVVIWQTIVDANGKLVSRRPLFHGKPVTGALVYVFDRAAETPPGLAPPIEVRFEKVTTH